MPLKEGSSKETISENISYCMSKYNDTGKVSGNPVGSKKKAMEICSAMAYNTARKSASSGALSRAIKRRRK